LDTYPFLVQRRKERRICYVGIQRLGLKLNN
jgi:hypothetical protein